MKILYVATTRTDAQATAAALHRVAPDVRVLWASHFDHASSRIQQTRDISALVAETQLNSESFASFLGSARQSGLTAPVVVLTTDVASPELELPPSLPPGVHTARSLYDLPDVISRAITGAGPSAATVGPTAKAGHSAPHDAEPPQTVVAPPAEPAHSAAAAPPVELSSERDLSPAREVARPTEPASPAGTSAPIQGAEPLAAAPVEGSAGPRSAAAAAADHLAQWQAELGVRLADAIRARSILERRVIDLETSLNERERYWAAEQAAAADRQAKFERLAQLENEARQALERELADAAAALQGAEERHRLALQLSVSQLAERQAQHDVAMARAAALREMVDEQFRQAGVEVARARKEEAAARAAAAQSRRIESELAAKLADAAATHEALERRLQDAADALKAADERASNERQATEARVAARESELNGLVQQEQALRAAAERALDEARNAVRDAEARHAATALLLEERRVQFDAQVADALTVRNALDQQARDLTAALDDARQSHAAAAADVERFKAREGELARQVSEAAAARNEFERQLTESKTELGAAVERTERERQEAAHRAAREREEAAERLAAREAQLDALLRQEQATRTQVEQELRQAQAALREAEEGHASAAASADALLAERQALFDARLTEGAAERSALEQRTRDLAAALDAARRDHAAALDAARQDHAAALDAVRHEHAAAAGEAAQLKAREAELDEMLRREKVQRAEVEQTLAQAQAALRDAEQQHAAAAETAAQLRAERQAAFDRQLAEAARSRSALEEQLQETNAALVSAREQHAAAAASADRLTARETALEGQLRQEQTTRADVEKTLAEVQTAMREAEERHASAATTLSQLLDERQAQLDAQVADLAATRSALEQQAVELTATLDSTRRDHAAALGEVERLTQSIGDLNTRLADGDAARAALELRLTEAAAALKDATEQAALKQAEASARHAEIEERLAQETQRREALDRDLARTRAVVAEENQRHRDEAAATAALAAERVAALEETLARERRAHEEKAAELQERLRLLGLERDSLSESIAATRDRLKAEAEQHLQDVRKDFQRTLDRATNEHAEAIAALVASVGERDNRIKEQAARHQAALQAAETERMQLQVGLRTTLATRNREIDQLKERLAATAEELDLTKARRDALQLEANRVPHLQTQIDDNGAEMRRQFEQSPLASCRCNRDGALVAANAALETLVGRKPGDLRGASFAQTVFESPGDLSWLIERCVSTRARQSVETTWKQRTGGRLFVRVSAFALSNDVVEIVAEDLTGIRALQDRLGQAHRMEAVGRLASEVAVTCGNLINEIRQDAEAWLALASADPAIRQQGELLLNEMSRAAGYLQRLAVYGEEEARTLAPVDLNAILRDLEPVLRRVAGDHVQLHVRKTSSPLNVDLKTKQVERLFVNLASYCRERMPHGGRLNIELATVVVDAQFIERYPNVRLGPHALITVTEVKHAMKPDATLGLRGEPARAGVDALPPKTGVDLGVLQTLIGECNGHLWMTIEPGGDMVAKIHLPLHGASETRPAHNSLLKTGSLLAARLLHS